MSEDYSNAYRDGYQYDMGHIPEEPVKMKKKKKKHKWPWILLAIVVIAALVFGGIKLAKSLSLKADNETKNEEISTEAPNVDESAVTDSVIVAKDVSGIVEQVMPSVVSITCVTQTTSMYGWGTQESEGAGSGFIIAKEKEKLMIATNNHVVNGATKLTVGFCDGTTAAADIVGTDSADDLAVISVKLSDIKKDTAKKIRVATLNDKDDLKVGQAVIAIGNALGYGQSVTTGVISALNREVSLTDTTMSLLQTDAAINPGNSGGVLINLKGEVIGINNAKYEDTTVEGMGFAIPMSVAKNILEMLMKAGTVSEEDAAYLGIYGKDITSQYAEAFGMPEGVYVSKVVEGSPAETAGISAGDVITAIDGSKISTMSGLKAKITLKKKGDEAKITLKRANQNGDYEEKTLTVTLGRAGDFAGEQAEQEEQQNQQGGGNGNDRSGQGRGYDDDNGYYYYDNGGNSFDPFNFFFNW